MTGPSGNRLSICPLRFRIDSVIRNSWGGDPEFLVANRSAYYLQDQSLFVYYLTNGTMVTNLQKKSLISEYFKTHIFSKNEIIKGSKEL